MADRTIYLTAGIGMASSRLLVKSELEKFGKVDLCNMGLRAKLQDMSQAPPVVKFATKESAEKAMAAICQGSVQVAGLALVAAWKSEEDKRSGKGGGGQRGGTSSRERMMGGGCGRNRSRSRSPMKRSRSRGPGGSRAMMDQRSGGGRDRGDRGGDRGGYGRRSPDRRRITSRSPHGGDRGPALMDRDRRSPPRYEPPRYEQPPALALTDNGGGYGGGAPKAAPPAEAPKPAVGTFTDCAGRHGLTEFDNLIKGVEYQCDICSVGYRKEPGLSMMVCLVCDYFVCQTCTDSYHGVLG